MMNTSAAKTALQINYVVSQVINPKLKQRYPTNDYQIRQTVGIDTSKLFVARTGIRGSNDLVWVGRAANYAAKLCSLNEAGYPSYITDEVFKVLHKSARFGNNGDGKLMWEPRNWTAQGIPIHRSSWWWKPD
jgi:class 3 adenylate cyclase